MLPNGVNIPMPKPYGGPAPVITRAPREDGTEGEVISVQFVGEIGPITQYLEFIDVLDTATPKDEVRILIDSPGGDVYTTQQLVGRMESCKAKVTTVASGLVASAATFLWFYGEEKEVDRWARFMFHSSLHGDWGKSLMIKETATELVNYMSNLLTAEMKAGILLAEEVRKILVDKADVELAGATVKARLEQVKAGEGAVNPEEVPATEPVVPAEGQPAEATPAAAPAEGAPAAVPTTTEPVTPVEPAAAPVVEPAAAPAEVPPVEPAATPAETTEEEPVLDLANLFAEELGIESPEPVKTPDNQPAPGGEKTTTESTPAPAEATPAAPEAKCGSGAKKPATTKKAAPVKVPAKKAAPAKQKLYKKVVKDDGSEEFVEVPEEAPAVAPAEAPVTPTEPAPAAVPPVEPATAPAVAPTEPVVTPAEPAPAVTPAPTEVPPAQPGEGETTPAVPGEINPEEVTPAVENPTDKCGKSKAKKAAKRKAIAALFSQLSALITEGETADSDVTVGENAEEAKPEQNKEVPGMGEAAPAGEKAKEAGQTSTETNTPKETPVVDIASIFAEELGEAAPVVTPVDPTEPKTEGATAPAQVPAVEPVVTPAETTTTPVEPLTNQLPGEGQPNDPVKQDPGTEVVEPEKDANKNSNAEVVAVAPRSRYW